ncbi:MAG: phosphatase PAP2 family protein [Candidatus Deferrimicrobium sp.]
MAMPLFLRIVLGLAVLLLPLGHRCLAEDNGVISRSIETEKTDFRNFYLDRANLTKLGIGVAGAAVFANTGMDRYLRNKYQDDLRSDVTDDTTRIFNISGTALALIVVPTYIGTYGVGKLLHNSTMEEWAQKSFRATIVGGPSLVFLAAVTGADRPTEGDSHWRPFQNFHGISGHSFIGSIPFITAAKMSENPYQKGIFYGLSTLPGLSRINDDKHYFSQVALAWYLAYLSCAAVEKGDDRQEKRVHVQLAPVPKGIAITVQKTY